MGDLRMTSTHKKKSNGICRGNALKAFDGAPERIRTSGLYLRRAALYPAELRAHYVVRVWCYGLGTSQAGEIVGNLRSHV